MKTKIILIASFILIGLAAFSYAESNKLPKCCKNKEACCEPKSSCCEEKNKTKDCCEAKEACCDTNDSCCESKSNKHSKACADNSGKEKSKKSCCH